MQLKWGIVSTGKISNDFVSALRNLPADEHTVVSVAARDKDRAVSFAAKFGIPNTYDTYEALAIDPEIDVVYVGNLNPQHFSTSKTMLENGKHVLCEKPLCMNYRETQELIKIAKEKGLFLMEAVWSRYFPVYKELKSALEKGTIGDLMSVTAKFGILIDSSRVMKNDMGGGLVLDLGVYTTQLSMLVFGRDTPFTVTAVGHLNSDKVDDSYSCIIKYPEGKMATLMHHSQTKFNNDAYVYGTKGYIKIHEPFWCPTKLTINNETFDFPLPENDDGVYNYVNSAGLHYEAAEVHRCIKEGLKESPSLSHADSLVLAKIEDDIRKQLGVKYMCDYA